MDEEKKRFMEQIKNKYSKEEMEELWKYFTAAFGFDEEIKIPGARKLHDKHGRIRFGTDDILKSFGPKFSVRNFEYLISYFPNNKTILLKCKNTLK